MTLASSPGDHRRRRERCGATRESSRRSCAIRGRTPAEQPEERPRIGRRAERLEGQRRRVLEPEHPRRRFVEGQVLRFGRVRRVVRRHGVDVAATQRRSQSASTSLAAREAAGAP